MVAVSLYLFLGKGAPHPFPLHDYPSLWASRDFALHFGCFPDQIQSALGTSVLAAALVIILVKLPMDLHNFQHQISVKLVCGSCSTLASVLQNSLWPHLADSTLHPDRRIRGRIDEFLFCGTAGPAISQSPLDPRIRNDPLDLVPSRRSERFDRNPLFPVIEASTTTSLFKNNPNRQS